MKKAPESRERLGHWKVLGEASLLGECPDKLNPIQRSVVGQVIIAPGQHRVLLRDGLRSGQSWHEPRLLLFELEGSEGNSEALHVDEQESRFDPEIRGETGLPESPAEAHSGPGHQRNALDGPPVDLGPDPRSVHEMPTRRCDRELGTEVPGIDAVSLAIVAREFERPRARSVLEDRRGSDAAREQPLPRTDHELRDPPAVRLGLDGHRRESDDHRQYENQHPE